MNFQIAFFRAFFVFSLLGVAPQGGSSSFLLETSFFIADGLLSLWEFQAYQKRAVSMRVKYIYFVSLESRIYHILLIWYVFSFSFINDIHIFFVKKIPRARLLLRKIIYSFFSVKNPSRARRKMDKNRCSKIWPSR